jgi:excisionase family DNA binding protein
MDMVFGWHSVDEVAARRGLSRIGVQKAIERGELTAHRVSNRWLVADEDLAWYDRVRAGRGRPLSPATSWLILLSPDFAGRLREPHHADHLRRQLRARAAHRQAFMHPRVADRVLARFDVHAGGRHAADDAGVPAGAGEHWDLYMRPSVLADLERSLFVTCQASAVGANTVVHIVDDDWPYAAEKQMPLSVAWCDLADAGDRAADLVADRMQRTTA